MPTPTSHDSADLDAAPGLVETVEGDLGPLDVLVTNTGGPPIDVDPLGFSREQWEAAYRDLVLAPMALIDRVVPGMKERGFGRILNVSSSAVREPIPVLMLSNVHRSGLLAGFKTLARSLAGDGITVNTVLPGRIATDRLADTQGSLEGAEAGGEGAGPRRATRNGRGVRRGGGVPVLRAGLLRDGDRRPGGRRPDFVYLARAGIGWCLYHRMRGKSTNRRRLRR